MTTIRDVAKRAGVAPITASRALSDAGYVSPETRARVRRAAAELNYVPNMLANSLRSHRTDTLALVLSDIANPFWTTVARGVEDEASRSGFTVIYCNTDSDERKQAKYVSMLLRRRVDGVLLVPASSSSEAVRTLQAQGVKVVLLDHALRDVPVDVVRGDSRAGARLLTEHLLALGHCRIALLNGPADLFSAEERAHGYRAALEAAGVEAAEELVYFGSYTVESGIALAEQVLARAPRPTAIFAANNFLAAGALHTLYAQGLRVPEDLSLVSFDDLPSEYLLEPFLTVARQPAYEMGSTAARLLLHRLGAPRSTCDDVVPSSGTTPGIAHAAGECLEVVLPTELVVRASSASPQPQQNLDK